MKNLVIDARESGTSTGRYIDNLVKCLAALKLEFDITLLAKPHRVEHFKQLTPRFSVLETPYKEFTFSEQLGYWLQITKLKADLVHFGKTEQPILYRGKTITTIHDLTTARFYNPSKNWLVFRVKQYVYKWVVKVVAFKSAGIIVPSEFVKKDLVKFTRVNPNKINVIYEASDKINDPPEPIKELEGRQFIMYVGRPQPHKNLDRLVDAFWELKKMHPELKLVLAGKKDVLYERLEQKVQKQGVPDVLFTGFISEGTLRWLYENTAAYIFPSLSEGFGLPGLEAMRHGAPVVSSNSTCLPEIYSTAAWYFNPYDTREIAMAINHILTNKSLRSKLITEGRKHAERFSWEKMAKQTLALYEKVL